MRFVFENLYANGFFVRTLNDVMIGANRRTQKHKNLIDYLCLNQKKIFILAEHTSFRGLLKKIFDNKVGRIVECYITCTLNGIKWRQVVILKREDIRKEDILLCYLFDRGINERDDIKSVKCYKILDLNHFYARIPQLKYNINEFDCLVSEANVVDHSELLHAVNNMYSGDAYVKPYSFDKRFQNNKDFSKRENRAIATGTWETLEEKKYLLFKEIYHLDCLHPMRKELYENKENWKEQIECLITHFPDDDIEEKPSSQNMILRWMVENRNKIFINRQQHYYQFDMAEMYNNYRMAIIPEEIVGLPGIGFVEAMACGCAFIGKDSYMYRELGMEAGVHYIAYNGTSEDLLEKIKYYQEHAAELEKIASVGYQFVREKLNGYVVARQFYKKMIKNARTGVNKSEA